MAKIKNSVEAENNGMATALKILSFRRQAKELSEYF